MSNNESTHDNGKTGYVKVFSNGMVPPTISSVLSGGTKGTVRDNGAIELDELDGLPVKLSNSGEIPSGTRVRVVHRRGETWAKPMDEHKRDQREKAAERHLKQRAREKELDRKAEDADEFWSNYDIPFDRDVAIKGRRSELLRGSSGTGRTSRTVTHLFVNESFEAGRLNRPEDTYLCTGGAEFQFEGERRCDSDGNEYIPKVTCKSCLKLMARWKLPDEE